MSKGAVLVIGSNASRIEVQGGGWGPTGNYLNETVVPIMTLISAGYDVQLATPNGTKPHMDKASDSAAHFGGDTYAYARAKDFWTDDSTMNQVRTLRSVIEEGLDKYAGVFVPGGQAPVVDLMQDRKWARSFTTSTINRGRRRCSVTVRLRSSPRYHVRPNFARL